MTSNKYAIVIVTYNRIQILQECVEKAYRQTTPAQSIIIINNASTDGTQTYPKELAAESPIYDIINLSQNIGGAGGFSKGIERAVQKDVESVLLIDDDAMLEEDYMEKLLKVWETHSDYKAFAGTVKVNGTIDTFHRRNVSRQGFFFRNCEKEKYNQPYFECEIASFCGMLVNIALIKQIGLPHAEYFIWHDDAEYSMRIRKYSKFLVVTDAILNHKTKPVSKTGKRRYDWREYYAVRNRILMVREHGNFCDRIVNDIDLFINVIFRNWLFSMIRKDGYDWNYERRLVREAIRNANSDRLENVIIKNV
ncbi:MAG: glycosyltransferase [Lachnospiraceae bacterium]|nr:glycosyltransferase [Lachnospiraceae bacterium]